MEVASNYAYGGGAPAGTVTVDLDADFDPKTDIAWDQDAEDVPLLLSVTISGPLLVV